MPSLMAVFAVPLALADTPLLHDGPPEDAVARAVALGAGPAWELDPLRPEQLLRSVHAGLVGFTSTCQRAPASSAELRKSVEFAEAMFTRQKWDATLRHIADAQAMLPCLTDEADAVRVAHLYLMDGIVALEEGREDDVRVAFDMAQRFGLDPSTRTPLQWNDRLASPDKGSTQLAQAATDLLSAQTGSMRFGPGVDPGRLLLRVDGRAIPLGLEEELPLPVGLHHIQVVSSSTSGRQIRTYVVDITEDQPVIVADPDGLTGLVLSPHVNTPALSELIRAAGIQGTTWVVAGEDTWTFDSTWTKLPPVNPLAETDFALQSARQQSAGIAAIITGAVVSSVGLWGLSNVRSAPPWETTPESVTWRQQQYWAWVGMEAVGLSSVAVGTYLTLRGQPRTSPSGR